MKRREFLKWSACCAAGSTVTGAGQVTPAASTPSASVAIKDSPVVEATIADLKKGLADGSWTAQDLTRWYLERIDQLDQNGPGVNSVIEVNPDAMKIAEQCDRERRDGKPLPPLHGIPVMVKDNLESADRMMTTAGSLALEGWHAKQDSTVVAKLRAAGAILLGKTNLSEWANFRSTNSSSGWSGRGGQTNNPYALDRNPCGSSSGSGAAAAASFCAAAVGTETNGSIVCPSSINGVVGIKPTLGQVSRAGIVPLAHSQDTAGPMARCVADAALMLAMMSGPDERDPATKHDHPSFSLNDIRLDPAGLKGKTIGVARNFFGFHPLVDQLMEDAIGAIKDGGATVIDELQLRASGLGRAGFDVLLYEFKADINEYLKGVDPSLPAHTLEELIQFNQEHADREMPYFGQELFEMAQEKPGLDDPAYQEALQKMRKAYREDGIDRLVNEHQLDAIIAPTTGPAWTTDLIHGDHGSGGSSSPAARAGYPNITVPLGYIFGLPVGISWIGPAFSEARLITLAYAFEQATKVRKQPQFLPSLKLDHVKHATG